MEDPSVFFSDFTQEGKFEKADGSFSFSTAVLYEEGETRHNALEVKMESKEAQVTLPFCEIKGMSEGDYCTTGGVKYEILDHHNDGFVSVFTLSPETGIARPSPVII